MKITPIKSFNSNLTQMNSFKGLWGKESHEYVDDYYEMSDYYDYEYYPFADETQEDIEKVKKNHQYYKSEVSKLVAEPINHVYSIVVTVMSALPFTSKDFNDYLNNKISDLKKRVIEQNIFEKNLRIKMR